MNPHERSTCIREALSVLGIERFVLSVHDASFPSRADDDIGRGSPYTRGGTDFLAFAHALGFDGVLLGPQGITSASNASPYDGTLFSHDPCSIDLSALVADGLVSRATLDVIVSERPGSRDRVAYSYAWHAHRRAIREAFGRFRGDSQRRWSRHAEGLSRFNAANAHWLSRDALFDALCREHGTDDLPEWRKNPVGAFDAQLFGGAESHAAQARIEAISTAHASSIERYRFGQYLAHSQHASWRERLAQWPMKSYGDLQIGLSSCDAWANASLLLHGYSIGAPPSRTTPAGQPWGYPLLHPAGLVASGARGAAAIRFFHARVNKLVAEFDGLRIDHPHGLVCPWVYDANDPDPASAVRRGARLFEAPGDPGLARFARVLAEQIDESVTPWDDHRVRWLTPVQIGAYATLFDELISEMTRHGRSRGDVMCEVLSTCPYPLAAVMSRHALGRFRVTQKSRLDDPRDVYRSENAAPADWIMVGTHDSEPLARVASRWAEDGEIRQRAMYLADRLTPESASESARADLARSLATDPRMFSQAMFADLFASPARNVLVFFADLFGQDEIYNVPGTVNDVNWTLRVPNDWDVSYFPRAARHEAMNIPRALAMALRARGTTNEALAARLDGLANRTE